jgi:hypothetical protein
MDTRQNTDASKDVETAILSQKSSFEKKLWFSIIKTFIAGRMTSYQQN